MLQKYTYFSMCKKIYVLWQEITSLSLPAEKAGAARHDGKESRQADKRRRGGRGNILRWKKKKLMQ